MSLKALAKAVLKRNQQGNKQETTRQYSGNLGVQNEAKKFPPKLTYVACIDCANLNDEGYCKAWKHHPDAPAYECRFCKQFVSKEPNL